jgi:hypothetical protein
MSSLSYILLFDPGFYIINMAGGGYQLTHGIEQNTTTSSTTTYSMFTI